MSTRTAEGSGFVIGDGSEQSTAVWQAQRYVRAKVLAVIPDAPDEAVTALQIAARADLAIEAVRVQMVRLRGTRDVVRIGCGSGVDPYRYFKAVRP